MPKTLAAAISDFGKAAAGKLSSAAISGEPEDQLRAPLEALLADLAAICGHGPNAVKAIGETHLSADRTRPDYAITVRNALVGFIEVKAPGKGADPRKFAGHDKAQWAKLKSLPNLLYTDGNSFSLWRDGELVGSVLHLKGDVETAGAALQAPDALSALFEDFLSWAPIPPTSARRLAEVSARLCRLLRDEVIEQLERKQANLLGLKADWRRLLFPEAGNWTFADGYAQAVTFGLLIARAQNIPLNQGLEHAASELKKSSSLIGTALSLLTENSQTAKLLETSLETMCRVLHEVDWGLVSGKDPEAWLYFYEHFLAVYDNDLRKETGSYYTPPEVVNAMVRLVDDVLRSSLFGRSQGLASNDVTIADPAVGTGTFLLGVLRKIAATAEGDMGPGGVPGAIRSAAQRLIGFELQFGPFAVAQLRLIAEMHRLISVGGDTAPTPEPKLFITDTLGNPFEKEEWLPQMLQPVAKSRQDANRIKREQKITVVIGNPPYKEKAEGKGGWIEDGSDGRVAPMARWRAPAAWRVGTHLKHLKNLYIYFWRWASLKVFGAGRFDATGVADTDEEGIVCFITVAGYLNGPGFQQMRADLRASCTEIWVIDCSPEGHQPEVATRIFQGVQQPVCIVLAAKKKGKDESKPATVHFTSLPEGRREAKFKALDDMTLTGGWTPAARGWRDAFLPAIGGQWAEMPTLASLFAYNGSGVMPGRTWVIAPDRDTLSARWDQLVGEKNAVQKERLFHPHLRKGEPGDKHVNKAIQAGLHGHEQRLTPVASDVGSSIVPTRYAFRSFDRQWIIPDARLINQPNPKLWDWYSEEQVYLTALQRVSPSAGPAITFSGLVPDLDHYRGSFGGRSHPLRSKTGSNIPGHVLSHLADTYHQSVSAEDAMAYIAALLAHPAFTSHFADDLKQPGLRVPLTTDPALFREAVELGREVIWLHTYGERFVDSLDGRPKGAPRLETALRPSIPAGGAIPGAPEPLPDSMVYDPATMRLTIGKGYIDNVMSEVWAYEVSGKNVLRQWFSYRRRDRSRPIIGDRRPPSPLDKIQPDGWLPEYTSDLMDLLHVLGRLVLLEPRQADLLQRILAEPLITVDALAAKAETTADS